MNPRWGTGSSSEYSDDRCQECGRSFERWEYQLRCDDCLNQPIRAVNWGLNNRLAMYGKGHSITTVDGKEYYHEEWAKNKVYKQYEEYERLENAPARKLAQENYQQLERLKQPPKETHDGM